ncbi:MAG: response regulator [Planctomycetes bacterium]|nr:response regulator [Planctomycetota bacterium]
MIRFLIVDDSEVLRNTVKKIVTASIRGSEFSFDEAADGEQAFLKYQAGEYDIITLDWHMPHMDGSGFLEKAKETNKPLPVLMCTIERGKENIMKALKLGVKQFLTKPFTGEELLKKIEFILKTSGKSLYPMDDQRKVVPLEERDVERRRFPRRQIQFEIRFVKRQADGRFVEDIMKTKTANIFDMSSGGICIDSENAMLPGHEFFCESLSSEKKFSAKCKVVRAAKYGRGYRYGCILDKVAVSNFTISA